MLHNTIHRILSAVYDSMARASVEWYIIFFIGFFVGWYWCSS